MSKKIDTTIPTIPTPELRSQPINMGHKAEFVCSYTELIFLPKLIAAKPAEPKDTTESQALQLTLMREAFKMIQDPELGEVYGRRLDAASVCVWADEQRNRGLDLSHYNLERSLFGNATPRGVGGYCSAMAHSLYEKLNLNLNHAGETYYNVRGEFNREYGSVYVPNQVRNLRSVLSDKKSQDPSTGVITRIPVIASQYSKIIPKSVQKKILKWNAANNIGTSKIDAVVRDMYAFSAELYAGLTPVRTTKQLQERWPEVFDDFCAVTGLGQCHGTALMPHHEVSTVNSLIAEFHNK